MGTSVPLTINEANSGNVVLYAVRVTGGGKCPAWTPAGGATTIAVAGSLNFTCTVRVATGVNSNDWSSDGQGLDTLNNAVPAAGEHVEGNLSGVSASTSLTFVSQVPPGASLESCTSVTITINEAHSFPTRRSSDLVTGGGKCPAWTPAGGATTIAVAGSLNFTCTFTVAAGANANAWSGDGQGLDTLNNAVPAARSEERREGNEGTASSSPTFVSKVPPGASFETGTSVTIMIKEATACDVAV